MANKKISKAEEDLLQKLGEVTQDLQRTRADFENYRKMADAEKTRAREAGRVDAVNKLLPVIDNIQRAVSHLPAELGDNEWAKGVVALDNNLATILLEIGVTKIDASPGVKFNPEMHDAVQFDENAAGETEVIEAELQPGYLLDGVPIRHAMVRVTRQ